MMAMLQQGAFSIVAGLFMISVLVVVHEAGHFLAAKLFGIGAPVFSVGMGPRLFGFQWRGTDYRVSAFPIGGYVQMAGADAFGEQDAESDVPPEQDFMRRPVWQRLIVMAAGPGVNLALPFVLFTVLLMLGRPDWNSRVGEVIPGTLAASAGLRPGDHVVSVDGEPVQVWHDVEERLEARLGTPGDVTLRIERPEGPLDVALPASSLRLDADGEGLDLVSIGLQGFYLSSRIGVDATASPAGRAGLRTGDHLTEVDGRKVETWSEVLAALGADGTHTVRYERLPPNATPDVPAAEGTVTLSLDGGAWTDASTAWSNPWGIAPITVFAEEVQEGNPAARAGLMPGDRVLAVEGTEVLTFHHFVELVSRNVAADGTPHELHLSVLRDGERLELAMTPEQRVVAGEAHARPIIGVGSFPGMGMPLDIVRKYYGLGEAIPRAASESLTILKDTTAILGNIATQRAKASENVGGPIAIFYVAGRVAEEGFFPYAAVIGMISVSLGVINLLPVPVLDGGQILFYALEAIRGRPLSLELRERFQMVGVVGLVILMLLVTANDLTRVPFLQRMIGP